MCDCLVSIGAPTVFAKNSDRPPGEAQVVEWHPPASGRRVTATYIDVELTHGESVGVLGSRPWWMWGLEHGVNEAGVAMGNETIYTTLDPRPFPPALTGMDIVRLALMQAATAKDAVGVVAELLERYGQGGSGHHGDHRPYWSSFLVADPTDAWVVETSGTTWEAEQVTDRRAISNRTTIPAFDAVHRHPKQPVETLVDPRWQASQAVLAVPEPFDVAAAKRHLRSHEGGDGGWTVCMHVEGVEETTASLVATLPTDGPPVARFLLGSPCRSIYVPLVVGQPIGTPPPSSWEPRDDELEEQLERDVRPDDSWAEEAWARLLT